MPTAAAQRRAIRAPYTGDLFEGASGGAPLPACVTANSCEIVPAATEYDYFPAPSITSVTTTSPGDSPVWVSEQGGTIATIDGKGFDYLAVDGSFGDLPNSHSIHYELINVTPTELTVAVAPHAPTTEPVARQLAVATLGGVSAGQHRSSSPACRRSPASVLGSCPDQGGGQIGSPARASRASRTKTAASSCTLYAAAEPRPSSSAATPQPATRRLSATTPGNNPGAFIVSVCTITLLLRANQPQVLPGFARSTSTNPATRS